jgi:hypothetical protein
MEDLPVARPLPKQHQTRSVLVGLAVLLHIAAAAVGLARAQSQPAPQRQGWTLEIHPGDVIRLTLRAVDASLPELAADLARQLKLPVTVDPALRQVPVTARFEERGLEEALPLLSPQVRVSVDYEVQGGLTQARPVAIYFQSDTTEAPPLPVAKAAAEVHVITGNTEDGEPTSRSTASTRKPQSVVEATPPLLVKVENNGLTVRARQQPLIAIIYGVAGQLGASVSVSTQTPSLQQLLTALTDVQLESADIESGVLGLSPAVRLYERRNLWSGEARILRIMLVEPSSPF